jgi:hypothetical protein
MIKAMQLTEPVVGSADNIVPLLPVLEQRVDDARHMEGVEVKVEEVAAGGS